MIVVGVKFADDKLYDCVLDALRSGTHSNGNSKSKSNSNSNR